MDAKNFKDMVNKIRDTEKLLGLIDYSMNENKQKSRNYCRSLYISQDIKKGEIYTENNIKSIRPGYGLHPKYLSKILGTKSTKDYQFGDRLEI